VHRQPLAENRFQLRLAHAAPAVPALELAQRPVEPGRAEDLAQRDIRDAGPIVGRGGVGMPACQFQVTEPPGNS
jgi:hypothetical protein